MFSKSFAARTLAFFVIFGLSLAIPSSRNRHRHHHHRGSIRTSRITRAAKKSPTFRHSFDHEKKRSAFYTGSKVLGDAGLNYLNGAQRFCKSEGGKLAITKDREEQMLVMEHIYKADANRKLWSDREYLLGGIRQLMEDGMTRNSTNTGHWRWYNSEMNWGQDARTFPEITGNFLWASPDLKKYVWGPVQFGQLMLFLVISTGSGFRAKSEMLSPRLIAENFACEYNLAKELPSPKSETPSCEFNRNKFTFHTNLLKKTEGEFFVHAKKFCQDQSTGHLAMTKTPEEQKAVMSFMKGRGENFKLTLDSRAKNLG